MIPHKRLIFLESKIRIELTCPENGSHRMLGIWARFQEAGHSQQLKFTNRTIYAHIFANKVKRAFKFGTA
jgi:hypothetical protein